MKGKKNTSRNTSFSRNTSHNRRSFDTDDVFDNDLDMDLENEHFFESDDNEMGSQFESLDCNDNMQNLNTNRNNRLKGPINASTCQQLADIIGGEVITATPVCVVQRLRNIRATILGRRTRSPLSLPFALSFENNIRGRTLNLGETVILQREINPFITALRERGIIITALHNHWLFDEPRLMYMHWENVGDPFQFARNSIGAAREAGLF